MANMFGATVSAISFGAFLGDFAFKMFEHVCGGISHGKTEKLIEHAAERFAAGSLPHNQHLETSLYHALGHAAQCLAYHLYDPERGRMRDLLENISDWPEFVNRFSEVVQGNIIAGTPREHWLANLIEQTKDPDNFRDFPLNVVLDNHQISRLLRDDSGAALRQPIHCAFLNWVKKHVPDNGTKPTDFADKVENGWLGGKQTGKPLAFYDVFLPVFSRTNKNKQRTIPRIFGNHVRGSESRYRGNPGPFRGLH